MSKEKSLENVKKLREITGVGFKDCKLALDENNGDIEKSVPKVSECRQRHRNKQDFRVRNDEHDRRETGGGT